MTKENKCPRCGSLNIKKIKKDRATGVYTGMEYPIYYDRFVCTDCYLIFQVVADTLDIS